MLGLSTASIHILSAVVLGTVFLAIIVNAAFTSKCRGPEDRVLGEVRRKTVREAYSRVLGSNRVLGGGSRKDGYTPSTDNNADAVQEAIAELYAMRDHPSVQFSEKVVIADDGAHLFVQTWHPTGTPRGVCFFLHGFADHGSHMVNKSLLFLCAEAGMVGICPDLRGHGQSDGLHVSIEFERIIQDVLDISHRERALYPDLPWFMYGESMGGCIALNMSLRDTEHWAGALLVAPMAKIADHMKPPQFVINLLTFIVERMPFMGPLPAVPGPDLLDFLFHDPLYKDLCLENPLSYRAKPRLATGLELLTASLDIEARLGDVTIPFLVQHGSEDVVTDPSVSQALFDSASSEDKEIKIYDGAWHALSFELPETVAAIRQDQLQWLNARSAQV